MTTARKAKAGRNRDPNDPNIDWRLCMRTLNEAAACRSITRLNSFRPTHSIWPLFDESTVKNAIFLADHVLDHQKELLENINAYCLIALVSVDVAAFRKTHVVNLAIKWLLRHKIETHIFHHILQSIHAPYLTLRRLGRVRLGIYIYLTSSELINYYDIYYEHGGSLCIRRKSGIPDDPVVFSDSDLLTFCKSINKITDSYHNPFWPEGTYRKDPEAPVFRKGKIHLPVISIVTPADLINYCFKWDFTIQGTPFTSLREPVSHFPPVDRPTILPHDPRAILKKFHQAYLDENSTDFMPEPVRPAFDFSPLPKKLERLTGRYQKSKAKKCPGSTETTTSGYGSIDCESVFSPNVEFKSENGAFNDFEQKCFISGSRRECLSSQSNSSYQISKQDITPKIQTAVKIPVKHRPGGTSKNNMKITGNRKCYRKFNDQKNLPNTNCDQQRQSCAQQVKSYPKKVTTGLFEQYIHPVIETAKPEKPKPKFAFDPIRNIIQQNY